MTDIIIQGIYGRMGRALLEKIGARDDCRVVAGVDRDAGKGKLKTGVLEGGPNAVSGFFDGSVRQTDDFDCRNSRHEIGFNFNGISIHAD